MLAGAASDSTVADLNRDSIRTQAPHGHPIVVVIALVHRDDSIRALEVVAIVMHEMRARLGRTLTKREWMPILGLLSASGGMQARINGSA